MIRNGVSKKKTSMQLNIPRASLIRWVELWKEVPLNELESKEPEAFKADRGTKKILSAIEEKNLTDYLTKASKMHNRLSPKQCPILAYQFAKLNKKKIPDSWENINCKCGLVYFIPEE